MESIARRFKLCGELRVSIAKDHDKCLMVDEMPAPKTKTPASYRKG
jgi:hypothetical protein